MDELREELFCIVADSSKILVLLSILEKDSTRAMEFSFFKCIYEAKSSKFNSAKDFIIQLKRKDAPLLVSLFLEGFVSLAMGEKRKSKLLLRQLVIQVRNLTDLTPLEHVAAEEGLLILGRLLFENSKNLDEGLGAVELLCLMNGNFSAAWELYGDYLLKRRNNSREAICCFERCTTPSSLKKLAQAYYSEGMYIKCLNLYLCHDCLSREDKTYQLSKLNIFNDNFGM